MNYQLINAQKALLARRQQAGIRYQPTLPVAGFAVPAAPVAVETAEAAPAAAVPLFHHGDVALAANRAGQSVHYQLWLAIRHLDADGRGWLTHETAQAAFCADKAANATYLYKKARIRQVLAEGNGRFWRLDSGKQRIFYMRESRLALALGAHHLTGRHVAIEPGQIFTNIQKFRAHCFAAWLSNHENPISQIAIEQLTGLTPRTQLRYVKLANIESVPNLSIGERYTTDRARESAWYHEGVFKFADFRGKQGPAGRRYVAWHLPSSYTVDTSSSSRRRQKRTNNQMADLRMKRDAGNGRLVACFFPNGALAAKAATRQAPDHDPRDYYWPGIKARSKTQLWHCLTLQKSRTVTA